MADISMCSGVLLGFICPLRDNCYRFTAPKNDHWQSYFAEVPYDLKKKDCEHYWKNQVYPKDTENVKNT